MASLPGLTRRKTMLFDEELQRADSMESLSVDAPAWVDFSEHQTESGLSDARRGTDPLSRITRTDMRQEM